jgi:hypothetical protein
MIVILATVSWKSLWMNSWRRVLSDAIITDNIESIVSCSLVYNQHLASVYVYVYIYIYIYISYPNRGRATCHPTIM